METQTRRVIQLIETGYTTVPTSVVFPVHRRGAGGLDSRALCLIQLTHNGLKTPIGGWGGAPPHPRGTAAAAYKDFSAAYGSPYILGWQAEKTPPLRNYY